MKVKIVGEVIACEVSPLVMFGEGSLFASVSMFTLARTDCHFLYIFVRVRIYVFIFKTMVAVFALVTAGCDFPRVLFVHIFANTRTAGLMAFLQCVFSNVFEPKTISRKI